MIQLWALLAAASSALLMAGCGSSSTKSDQPVTVYGTLTLTDPKAGPDNGAFQLTSSDACTRNADTGRVDVTMSQGAGKPALALAIKDYSSTPKVYTCKQAADNATSDTDVGGKFESCMVDAKVLAKVDAATLNGYSMYRETAALKKFAYAGACTIDVSAATPAITGKVACKSMLQTTLEGAPRNPYDPGAVADVSADFTCTFR